MQAKVKYCNGSPAVETRTAGGLIANVSVGILHLEVIDKWDKKSIIKSMKGVMNMKYNWIEYNTSAIYITLKNKKTGKLKRKEYSAYDL